MTDLAAKNYLERSRHDRRVELARLAHERQVNMSVVMGLSWRVRGHQAHVDYTGGLDTARICRGLASSFGGLSWRSGILSRFLDVRGRDGEAAGGSGAGARTAETQRMRGEIKGRATAAAITTTDWRDAVARAAPVEYQRPEGYRLDAETDAEHRERLRGVYEKKLRDFASVLERVDKVALANLARELLEQRRKKKHVPRCDAAEPVPLPVIGDPTFGSGHMFYVIRFPGIDGWKGGTGIDCDGGEDGRGGRGGRRERERKRGDGDGVRWIAKIPAATATATNTGEEGGGRWNGLCCETLRSEAFLLHMLREETSVPVPEVIDADCRPDNEIGVPWLLMEYVEGRRLEDVWFAPDSVDGSGSVGESVDGGVLNQRREKILRNVAVALLELGKYEFDCGGAVVFGRRQGELVDTTGPLREIDVKAMVLRWFEDEDCLGTPLYRPVGPWEHPRDMCTAFLDAWPPGTVEERGVDALLRLLLGLVQEPGTQRKSLLERTPRRTSGMRRTRRRTNMKKFVLTHPELSMRNIILAEDGTTIKAILGWDGARATPRSVGNEALPRWLVRDFNPFVWQWKPDTEFWRSGHVSPQCNCLEDPPWVLRELRAFYANVVRELKEGGEKGKEGERQKGEGREREVTGDKKANDHNNAGNENHEDDGYVEVDITKQSLLTLTLDAVIRDPRCRASTLRRLLEKCSRPLEELDFDYFVDTLGEGYEIDAYKLKCLANNVKELVDKGFVKGAVVW